MLYENGYDEEGNMTYLLTDEVDPNFYQSVCPFEPEGYYPGCSDDDDDDDDDDYDYPDPDPEEFYPTDFY